MPILLLPGTILAGFIVLWLAVGLLHVWGCLVGVELFFARNRWGVLLVLSFNFALMGLIWNWPLTSTHLRQIGEIAAVPWVVYAWWCFHFRRQRHQKRINEILHKQNTLLRKEERETMSTSHQ